MALQINPYLQWEGNSFYRFHRGSPLFSEYTEEIKAAEESVIYYMTQDDISYRLPKPRNGGAKAGTVRSIQKEMAGIEEQE